MSRYTRARSSCPPERAYAASALRVDARLTGLVEKKDVVPLLPTAHVHPRRAHRHPGHREPECLRALAQEAANEIGRDVSFEDIRPGDGGVAGLERRRHAETRLDLGEVVHVDRLDVVA